MKDCLRWLACGFDQHKRKLLVAELAPKWARRDIPLAVTVFAVMLPIFIMVIISTLAPWMHQLMSSGIWILLLIAIVVLTPAAIYLIVKVSPASWVAAYRYAQYLKLNLDQKTLKQVTLLDNTPCGSANTTSAYPIGRWIGFLLIAACALWPFSSRGTLHYVYAAWALMIFGAYVSISTVNTLRARRLYKRLGNDSEAVKIVNSTQATYPLKGEEKIVSALRVNAYSCRAVLDHPGD